MSKNLALTLATGMLVSTFLLGCEATTDSFTPMPTGASEPTEAPSVAAPSAAIFETPTVSAEPGTPAWLLSLVPAEFRSTCRSNPTNEVASLSCKADVASLDYILFPDATSLNGEYNQQRSNFGGAKPGDCTSQINWPCETQYESGHVAFLKGGATSVLWTDDRYLVLAHAYQVSGLDDQQLLDTWKAGAFGLD